MCQPQIEEVQNAAMSDAEMEAFLNGPATRGEVLNVTRGLLDQEVLPTIDSKFAFLVDFMRFVLAASGAVSAEQFNQAYKDYAEEFLNRFGTNAEEDKPSESVQD